MRVMLTIIAAGVAVAALGAAGSEPNRLTEAEKNDGWQLLFDGKTTSGWRGFNKPTAPEGWTVVDGALTRTSKAGDLVTTSQYGDFDLTFEWRIAAKGNSGVFYRVAEGPDLKAVYVTGPEYQILDDAGHPDARNGPDRYAGANYALHPPLNATIKPVGEWNASRILVKGSHVEHWLNGSKVVEYELWSADWRERVAKSKFRTMPRYGMEKRGHIALQDHGDEVAFRSIKIRVLDTAPATETK